VTQQGFLVAEAVAANVTGRATLRTTGGSVVGTAPGASLRQISGLTLGVNAPSLQGALPETAGLFSLTPAAANPAAEAIVSEAEATAPKASAVSVPGAAAARIEAGRVETLGSVSPAEAAPNARLEARRAGVPAAGAKAAGAVGGLQNLAKAIVPGARAGSLGRFFDTSRIRLGSPAAAANAGDAKTAARRSSLERPEAWDAEAGSGKGLRFYLLREGEAPVVADGETLKKALADDPGLLETLNDSGRVRVIYDKKSSRGGLAKEDVGTVESLLRDAGVTARTESEGLAVDWSAKESADARAPGAPVGDDGAPVPGVSAPEAERGILAKWVIGPILGFFRELKFLGRTLASSFTAPLWSEVFGGVVSKSFPFFVALGAYWAAIGPSHPWLLGAAIGITLFLEVFHGIFLNTWNEFQHAIKKKKGLGYQVGFTWLYMQSFGAALRTLSWAADPTGKVSPIWSLVYWKDLILMSVIGTFFGTLGINGLNALYEKGRIRRWQRSGIQQVRDLMMLLAGPLFATGNMWLFWTVFSIQQTIDLGIYLVGTKAKSRTVLYASTSDLADTEEFQGKYPVQDQRGKPSPLKQAWQGLADGPFGRAIRALLRVFRRGPPAEPPVNGADAPRAPPAEAAAKRAPDSLSDVDLTLDPNEKYYPSPEDWRDENFYLFMVDRFAKSRNGKPVGDPADGGTRHGGDLQGAIEKLDYLQKEGVTTLVMTPVTHSLPEAYHGYATMHFLDIDPHIGSIEDFKKLVAEAHARGMRVLMDLVVNHTGPVFDYVDGDEDGSPWQGKVKETIWRESLYPTELAKDEHFTRMGKIRDWNDSGQSRRGDFPPNYRHVATDRPETRQLMIDIAKYWMKEADIDGFRLDAIRHVAEDFWPHFMTQVRAYAKEMGKDNFLLLGENSTGVDGEIAADLAAGFDTLYNYPAYRRENYAMHGAAPTKVFEDSLRQTQAALGAAAGKILRFIDLHDTYRFLRTHEPIGVLHAALGYLFFSTGIPLLYYGTEQAFRQDVQRLDPEGPDLPADPRNREDMFGDGKFKSDSSSGDRFDVTSATFRHVRQLTKIRAKHAALRRGEQFPRWADPNGAGIYAFSRIYEGQEVLVVINTAKETRGATMWVDGGINPAGSVLEDELDPQMRTEAFEPEGGGSQVNVWVPAHGVRVFVKTSSAESGDG
jgi:glycosidase